MAKETYEKQAEYPQNAQPPWKIKQVEKIAQNGLRNTTLPIKTQA